MKQISILGCGWLGIKLARRLISKGYEVKGSTTTKKKVEKFTKSKIIPYRIIFTPIINKDADHRFFIKSDVLIIALPPKFQKEKDKYFFVLQQVKKTIEKNKIKKIILLSTTSVYEGKPSDKINDISEDYEINTTDEKSQLIQKSENLFLDKNNNFSSVVLRLAGLVGDKRNPKNYLKKSSGRSLEQFSNLIHYHDICNIIALIIEKNIFNNEIYNLVSDVKFTRRELYQKIDKPTKPASPNKVFIKRILNEKIKKKLGYKFKYKNILKWVEKSIP